MRAAEDGSLVMADAAIPTWFGVGGRADALASPGSAAEARALVRGHGAVRVLGDGANLLVDDEGVDGLVLSTENLTEVIELEEGVVCAEAGVNLPKLIVETVRRGWGGLEGLAGVPASVGGAAFMNAGGAFGQFADVVERLHLIDAEGNEKTVGRSEVAYGYRYSGLLGCVILAAEIRLTPGDPGALRDRLKEVMAIKKHSQPMREDSAGCVFKNPLVDGERVSAGKIIDGCGCKGMGLGGAVVSHVHANFIVTREGCSAGDVMGLMDAVRARVLEEKGIELETEIVIWRRGDRG